MLLGWLDRTVPPDHSDNLVALHRNFYETARRVSGLNARAVTLAFKDWVHRRHGRPVAGMPLDEKLYAIKSMNSVSLATLQGRVTVPFRVEGYGPEWIGGSPARLVPVADSLSPDGFDLVISTDVNPTEASAQTKEVKMAATESTSTRIGRIIASMAHAAIDAVEGVSPEAIIEQSLREIDAAAEEVRAELGKVTAERFRLNTRQGELESENEGLEGKIRAAADEHRDDLAEAGIARQIDIEAQVAVLQRLIGETDTKLDELGQTMDAIAASRREAEERLKAFRASRAEANVGGAPGARSPVAAALAKVDRARAVTERITGVPSGPESANPDALKRLHELARHQEIKARLGRLKSAS
jgi:phage shock protein A